MIPAASDKGRFFALGRILSGTLSTGMKVRIMDPDYVPGGEKKKENVLVKTILIGSEQETMEDMPCGNILTLYSKAQFITKNAILTNTKEVDAHPIRAMKRTILSKILCCFR